MEHMAYTSYGSWNIYYIVGFLRRLITSIRCYQSIFQGSYEAQLKMISMIHPSIPPIGPPTEPLMGGAVISQACPGRLRTEAAPSTRNTCTDCPTLCLWITLHRCNRQPRQREFALLETQTHQRTATTLPIPICTLI